MNSDLFDLGIAKVLQEMFATYEGELIHLMFVDFRCHCQVKIREDRYVAVTSFCNRRHSDEFDVFLDIECG